MTEIERIVIIISAIVSFLTVILNKIVDYFTSSSKKDKENMQAIFMQREQVLIDLSQSTVKVLEKISEKIEKQGSQIESVEDEIADFDKQLVNLQHCLEMFNKGREMCFVKMDNLKEEMARTFKKSKGGE